MENVERCHLLELPTELLLSVLDKMDILTSFLSRQTCRTLQSLIAPFPAPIEGLIEYACYQGFGNIISDCQWQAKAARSRKCLRAALANGHRVT